jgi:N-acetylneuraminate epimerase
MSLLIDSFPALPVGIKNGIGGLLGTRLYVGLGSAGKQLFYYDLEQPESGWQQAADFPGTERNDACYVVSNDKLYVFPEPGNCQMDTHQLYSMTRISLMLLLINGAS